MGKEKKNITEKYTTGKGELVGFVSLSKPSTKFDKTGKNGYVANILLDKKEGEELTAKFKALRTEQFKTYGKGTKVTELPISPYEIVNEETGEATPDAEGRYLLKTKASAYIENGKVKFRPCIVNAKKIVVNDIGVSEGSIVRLSLVLSGYSVAGKTGVSAKLKGCQIIKLVEYNAGDVSDDFDEEEGFDGVGEEFKEETSKAEDTEADDEEADF